MASAASTTTSAASATSSHLLGPLTTTWTAPSSCMTPWLACSTCSSAWQGQTCLSSATFEGDLNCWPTVTTSTYTPPFKGLGYYSPGLICPSGYQTACAMQGSSDGSQATVSAMQSFNFEYTPTLGETAVGCCPTGFACTSNNGQICGREVASTSTTIWSCGTEGSTVTTDLAFPELFTITSAGAKSTATSTSTSTITSFTVFAPLYQLNYQSSDLETSTSSSSTSSSSSQTTTSATTTTSAAAASSTTASSGSSSSNHHTTTIAVAVTVPIVVVAFIAAGLGWWFYRKRAAAAAAASRFSEPTELSATSPITEMAGSVPPKPPVELSPDATLRPNNIPPPGTVVHEMDAGDQSQHYFGGFPYKK